MRWATSAPGFPTCAWLKKPSEDINELLSGLARTVRDYVGGLDSAKGKTLLRNLAELGNYLHLYLVESQRAGAGGAARGKLFEGEFIQIVSTRSDAVVIPFEFIYEYDAPADDAELCPHWRDAHPGRSLPGNVPARRKLRFVRWGFWGLSKVIERHALQADLAREGEVGCEIRAGRRSRHPEDFGRGRFRVQRASQGCAARTAAPAPACRAARWQSGRRLGRMESPGRTEHVLHC